MNSLKAKLISTLLKIGFTVSLIGLGLSSFAWFSQNKTINAKGLNVSVDPGSNVFNLTCKLYKYDFDKKEGVEYIEGTDDFNLDLNKFDNFIRERNINNNNIIRFSVDFLSSSKQNAGKRKLSIISSISQIETGEEFDGGFTDGIKRTHIDDVGYEYHKESDDKNYVCNNISNIIYFKCIPYSYQINGETKYFSDSLLIDETNADTIYKTATQKFNEKSEQFSFVSNDTKTSELMFNVVEVDSRATNVVFYVEYNYNENLVDDFLKETEIIGSDETSGIGMLGSAILFKEDIEKIAVKSVGVTNE